MLIKFSLLHIRLYLPLLLTTHQTSIGFLIPICALFDDRAPNQAAMPMTPVAVS